MEVQETVNAISRDGGSTITDPVNPDPVNTAPTISGTPATTASSGSTYSFTPNANDAEGDALTFSISGLPSWATFDRNTGELSGITQDTDAGLYSNILISVSDS